MPNKREDDITFGDTVASVTLVGAPLGTFQLASKFRDKDYRQNIKSKLTGMDSYYHSTSYENKERILREGLKGEEAVRPGSITERMLDTWDRKNRPHDRGAFANKVYFTPNKNSFGHLGDYSGPLEMRIPYVHLHGGTLKKVNNPELRGMTEDQFANLYKEVGLGEEIARSGYKTLSEPNTYVVEGSVSPKYFVDSPHYKKDADWFRYIQKFPKRFGAGALPIAGIGGGLAATGFAGKYLYDRVEEEVAKEREQMAFEFETLMQKTAQLWF